MIHESIRSIHTLFRRASSYRLRSSLAFGSVRHRCHKVNQIKKLRSCRLFFPAAIQKEERKKEEIYPMSRCPRSFPPSVVPILGPSIGVSYLPPLIKDAIGFFVKSRVESIFVLDSSYCVKVPVSLRFICTP